MCLQVFAYFLFHPCAFIISYDISDLYLCTCSMTNGAYSIVLLKILDMEVIISAFILCTVSVCSLFSHRVSFPHNCKTHPQKHLYRLHATKNIYLCLHTNVHSICSPCTSRSPAARMAVTLTHVVMPYMPYDNLRLECQQCTPQSYTVYQSPPVCLWHLLQDCCKLVASLAVRMAVPVSL